MQRINRERHQAEMSRCGDHRCHQHVRSRAPHSNKPAYYIGDQPDQHGVRVPHHDRRGDWYHQYGYQQLSVPQLASLEPDLLVNKVNSQIKEFQQAIGDASTPMADVVKVLLKLLKLASKHEFEEQSNASKIIAEILSERSEKFHFQMKRAAQSPKCTMDQAEMFCDLFESMLQTFESLAKDCLPIDELLETVKRLTKAGTTNPALLERAENLCETRDQIRDKQTNPTVISSGEWDDSGYQSLSILPEWKEIKEDKGTPPEVRPNKVDTPYKDWMEYYDIQFRLIREDFIAPLRRGVAAFLQGVKNRDIKIYSAASIVSQVSTEEKGICFMVKFDCKRKCNWKQSKRLIFGSLLCFIPKNCKLEMNVLFATVANRDIKELQEGKIMVHFEGNTLCEAVNHCVMGTDFEIIESNSYFEATGPILKSIQKAELATMPFTKQLIEGKYDSNLPPIYLRNEITNPKYNLSCLHGPVKNKPPLMIEVLNKESWEAGRDSELDPSQLNAIQTALTQEIAVIQGPPGTGKTYIGLKIVEALLENRRIWDPRRSCPILVMCYTNHALDQFLEGIMDTECCGRKPKIIRVGGRCKNEKVNCHNLSQMRKVSPTYKHDRDLSVLIAEKYQCNPHEVWQDLKNHYKRNTLLPLYIVQQVAHPYHYYQLTQMAQCEEQQHKEVEVWLDLWHLTSTNAHPMADNERDNHDLIVADENFPVSNIKSDKEFLEPEDDTALMEYDNIYYDDHEGYKSAKSLEYFTENLKRLYVHPYSEVTDNPLNERQTEEEDEVEKVWSRKADADNLIKLNLRKDSMDEEEVEEIFNTFITTLSICDRWRLYNYWEEQWYNSLQETNREKAKEYNEKCNKVIELKQREDQWILESADVVGMTTTGAAKYQHILHHIKPKIVIVEEAAEVLEAHIVSALSAGTQHLILIGDHKQLRPKPNEYVLETKYNLSISLFERLVMKQMSQATLEIQHRMRPEIARLVCPHVYEKLLNHESVENYPNIKGIAKNLFFLCHTEPESEHPGLLSYQNQFEADYIVGFCAHLLRLGYSPSQITILTPYVGQLLLIRDKLLNSEVPKIHVTAIDNFQGEENDIILFSMVRSTNPNSSRTTIGFVKEDNRVCVSLSRAKQGFYAIGNFELIRHQSQLWESIISDVESRECYGNALPLYCCNHPETKYSAMKDSDFIANAPNGGCNKVCDIRLPCGHSCTKVCHVVDTEHAMFSCKKLCERKCPNGHKCQSTHDCYIACPPCHDMVEIIMPQCGHKQMIECYQKRDLGSPVIKCTEIVPKTMPRCGHEQNMLCSTDPMTMECKMETEKVIPGCNHKQMVPCFMQLDQVKCRHECIKVCSNGLHKLKKNCADISWPPCKEKVNKELSTCGHTIEAHCFEDYTTILCDKPCERSCEAGHKCLKLCHEACAPCTSEVQLTLLCGHTHLIPCPLFIENTFKCPTKCLEVNCERGHLCKETCHYPQPCEPCKEIVTIQFPSCSHPQQLECYKSLNPSKYGFTCKNDCKKRLQCSHICHKKCGDVCQQVCNEKVRVDLECGHMTKTECHRKLNQDFLVLNCRKQIKLKLVCGHTRRIDCWMQEYKLSLSKECKKSCKTLLRCGHPCQETCGNPCTTKCKYLVKRYRPCGHEVILECFQTENMDQYPCDKTCSKNLACGHPCRNTCGEPCSQCDAICSKKLACGHPCRNTCGKPCSTCELWSMRRYPCGHSSKISCTSNIEAYPCKKNCKVVLSCGHRCSGKCGDCSLSGIHAVCIYGIRLHHYSGHSVDLPCAGLSDPCDYETPDVPCAHTENYTKCHQPCSWDCKHFQCSRECGEECDRPPCNILCGKKLSCGCMCPGLCGERCMSVCLKCDKNEFLKQLYPKVRRGDIPQDQPFFELGCGHIFTVRYLDEYMEHSSGMVQPKQCPKCHQNVAIGSRYGNAVRRAITDVMNVDKKLKEQRDTIGLVHFSDDVLDTVEKHGPHSQYFNLTQIILHLPRGSEKNCLVELLNSSMNIHLALQQYAAEYPSVSSISEKVMHLAIKLINHAVREPQVVEGAFTEVQKAKLHVTIQLLNDFKSELYRLALRAQCLIVKSHYPTLEGTKRMRLTSESQDVIDNLEQSVNCSRQKISDDKYEDYFKQIERVAPDVGNLHVQAPQIPPVTKGMWRKCSAGHYFCIPHICGPVSKLPFRCPDCT